MSFRTPGFGSRLGSGRSRLLVPVLAVLAIIVVLFLVFTAVYTDLLWFRSVDSSSVYTTRLRTEILLFVGSGLLMALVVGANMMIAYRLRPAYRPLSVEQQGLERYRAAVDPHRRLIGIAVVGVLALLTGSSISGQWQIWLAFMNRTPFGVRDPQFGKDVSFFVFTYPFLRLLLGFLFAMLVLSILVALVVHYLYGGLRLQGPGDKASPPARAHLSVLVGTFVLLKAVAYWFDRWGLAHSDRGVVGGPSYTDVNAVLPAKTILAVIAVICAALFFVNIVRRGMMLPGVGLGLLVLSAILVGGVYPLLIQQFQVRPNEAAKEAPYIQRNIQATRAAYGVNGAQVTENYTAKTTPNSGELGREAQTISGVRLLDPALVSRTYQQLQQIRSFYQFPDQLDIDRYPVDGQGFRDTVVAVREITGPPAQQNNWINQHTVYTHGYGFVAAPGNKIDPNGLPDFVAKDMPPTGPLVQQTGLKEPRIYFGENSPRYSVVGAPPGSAPKELDYPESGGTGQKNTTYTGNGGVSVGSFFNRMLYAVKFQEKNLLLSGSVNGQSKILYDRTPRERVQKVAPWLTIDGDPYPAIVGGRITWILDGYTTTDGYPYSERISLADATSDTSTETRTSVVRPSRDRVNYMRNSVKATVDAYDGTVRLYAWDEKDPVLRTWMKAFPGVVKPYKDIGSNLMQHLRYPQDLFKVQRGILAKYHVTQADAFYGGQDFWNVPDDPTQPAKGRVKQPPYYLSLKMPGDPNPAFSLTTAFVPRARPNMAAFMSVDATPGSTYGKIRILQLPGNTGVQGPGQAQNTINADPKVSSALNLLRQGGASQVLNGNLLTLPFGGGLLYVQPVYVQAQQTAGQEPYPILQRVVVMFGNKVGFGGTLDEALKQIFPDDGAAPPGDDGGDDGGDGGDAGTGELSAEAQRALADAQKAYADGQAALRTQDWAAYGEAQQRLKAALDRLAAIRPPAPAASPSPTPTPTPTASPPS
ncbi:UPF0182 family protein [Actinomadura craniellae]|uniref:UPF0182 protein DPM19_19820 n=1 Tax=Actinomadura craniellae TaxID=2231787 RepID=A0A365H2K7_9ACTN|nr:UPF0182 family protein [Actinomadura craniellae]RAY13330.1 UPF0182 family protein [Actinomadura craniellae]